MPAIFCILTQNFLKKRTDFQQELCSISKFSSIFSIMEREILPYDPLYDFGFLIDEEAGKFETYEEYKRLKETSLKNISMR